PWSHLVVSENLPYQPLGAVAANGAAEPPCCRDAEPSDAPAVRQDENRGKAASEANAALVDPLEIAMAPEALMRAKLLALGHRLETRRLYSLLTVSRFRPFARRRFRTSRPFFVRILVRNPCAFRRRRVLG